MIIKCNEEELCAIQDIVYYSLLFESCNTFTTRFPSNTHLCNSYLGHAFSIALELYLSKLEQEDGYKEWYNANNEIMSQINEYIIEKDYPYNRKYYKKKISESFKIEKDDELIISIADTYLFDLEYDSHILKALIDENIDEIVFHYKTNYKDIDLDMIKSIYTNIFLYDRVNDHISNILKTYRKVINRIWST